MIARRPIAISIAASRPAAFASPRAWCAVLAFLCLSAVASADPVRIERGDLVRVESPRLQANPVVGTFDSADAESLLFVPASGHGLIALALHEISTLEISRGRPRRTWWGALAGAVVFGALGAYAGSQATSGSFAADEVYTAGVAIAFAIPGAGLGALAGAFIRGDERWERVSADRFHQGPE